MSRIAYVITPIILILATLLLHEWVFEETSCKSRVDWMSTGLVLTILRLLLVLSSPSNNRRIPKSIIRLSIGRYFEQIPLSVWLFRGLTFFEEDHKKACPIGQLQECLALGQLLLNGMLWITCPLALVVCLSRLTTSTWRGLTRTIGCKKVMNCSECSRKPEAFLEKLVRLIEDPQLEAQEALRPGLPGDAMRAALEVVENEPEREAQRLMGANANPGQIGPHDRREFLELADMA